MKFLFYELYVFYFSCGKPVPTHNSVFLSKNKMRIQPPIQKGIKKVPFFSLKKNCMSIKSIQLVEPLKKW